MSFPVMIYSLKLIETVSNFRISYDGESKINCSAFRLSTKSPNRGTNKTFVGGTTPLLSWVTDVINESKDQPHL